MLFNHNDPSPSLPYGQQHPEAPTELDLFAFMIGEFDCSDCLLMANGSWKEMKAVWHTHYTLNGYAIQDNYRNEIYAGMSIRTYSSPQKAWQVAFFGMPGGHTGLWQGGRQGSKIVLTSEQTAPDGTTVISRLTFSDITLDGFEWLGEKVLANGQATPNWQISARRRT